MSRSRMMMGVSAGLFAGVIGCGNKATPKPEKDPVPPPTASATAASVVTAAPAPKGIPTFTLEKFAPAGTNPSAVFAVEGALMVVEEQRVGRIVDETIEWVGKIPKGSPALGDNIIQSVVGYWPDGIGVHFVSGNGRAPEPTYWPLTGKGLKHVVAEGGGWGWIQGPAHIGESSVVVSMAGSYTIPQFTTLRGPGLPRTMTKSTDAGCKKGEIPGYIEDQEHVAISPGALESSPAGTLVSLGRLCERAANPAAEVWDKTGKSKIVDLSAWWKRIEYRPTLAKGSGDELFAYSDVWNPVLRYHDGAFEPLPRLERPIQDIFTSPKGQLFAHDGAALHTWADGKWIVVGRFAPKIGLRNLVVDEKGTFWANGSGVHRLKEAPAEAKAEEAACSSWFVYVYPVNEKSEPKFTFPATRKALSSFPEAADLTLVDIGEQYWHRHLGLVVKSKAQGEAVVAHVKATMKDEDPRLFCYTPPEKARRLDMDGKSK